MHRLAVQPELRPRPDSGSIADHAVLEVEARDQLFLYVAGIIRVTVVAQIAGGEAVDRDPGEQADGNVVTPVRTLIAFLGQGR